jgi:hypothetical protein
LSFFIVLSLFWCIGLIAKICMSQTLSDYCHAVIINLWVD